MEQFQKKERQELLGRLENEKLELKNYFEKQIVAERKLAEEKAKNLKLELQLKEQRILAEQGELNTKQFWHV